MSVPDQRKLYQEHLEKIGFLKSAARFFALNPDASDYFGFSPNHPFIVREFRRFYSRYDPKKPRFLTVLNQINQAYDQVAETPGKKVLGRHLKTPQGKQNHKDNLKKNRARFKKGSKLPSRITPNERLSAYAAQQVDSSVPENPSQIRERHFRAIAQKPTEKKEFEQIVSRQLTQVDLQQQVRGQVESAIEDHQSPVLKQAQLKDQIIQAAQEAISRLSEPYINDYVEAPKRLSDQPIDFAKKSQVQPLVLEAKAEFASRLQALFQAETLEQTPGYQVTKQALQQQLSDLHPAIRDQLVEQAAQLVGQTFQQTAPAPEGHYQTELKTQSFAGTGYRTEIKTHINHGPINWSQRFQAFKSHLKQSWAKGLIPDGPIERIRPYLSPSGGALMVRQIIKQPFVFPIKQFGFTLGFIAESVDPVSYGFSKALAAGEYKNWMAWRIFKDGFTHPIRGATTWISQRLLKRPVNALLLGSGLWEVDYKTKGFGKHAQLAYAQKIVFKPWNRLKKKGKKIIGNLLRWGGQLIYKGLKWLGTKATLLGLKFAGTKIGSAVINSGAGKAVQGWISQGLGTRWASFIARHPAISTALKGSGFLGRLLLSRGIGWLFNIGLWITDPVGMFLSNVYFGSWGGFIGGTAGAGIGYMVGGLYGALVGFTAGSLAGHIISTAFKFGLQTATGEAFLTNLIGSKAVGVIQAIVNFGPLKYFNFGAMVGGWLGWTLAGILGLPLWAQAAFTLGGAIGFGALWAKVVLPWIQSTIADLIISPITGAISGLSFTSIVGAITVVGILSLYAISIFYISLSIFKDAKIAFAPNESACFRVTKTYEIIDANTGELKPEAEPEDLVNYQVRIIPLGTIENVEITDIVVSRITSTALSQGSNVIDQPPTIIESTIGDPEIEVESRSDFTAYKLIWEPEQLVGEVLISYQIQLANDYNPEVPIENQLVVDGTPADSETDLLGHNCLISVRRYVNGPCQEMVGVAERFLQALESNRCPSLPRTPTRNLPVINQTTWPIASSCLSSHSVPQDTIDRLNDIHLSRYECAQCYGTLISWGLGAGINGWQGGCAAAAIDYPPPGYELMSLSQAGNAISRGDIVVWGNGVDTDCNNGAGHIALVLEVGHNIFGQVNSITIAEALGVYEDNGRDFCGAISSRTLNLQNSRIDSVMHCQ